MPPQIIPNFYKISKYYWQGYPYALISGDTILLFNNLRKALLFRDTRIGDRICMSMGRWPKLPNPYKIKRTSQIVAYDWSNVFVFPNTEELAFGAIESIYP